MATASSTSVARSSRSERLAEARPYKQAAGFIMKAIRELETEDNPRFDAMVRKLQRCQSQLQREVKDLTGE